MKNLIQHSLVLWLIYSSYSLFAIRFPNQIEVGQKQIDLNSGNLAGNGNDFQLQTTVPFALGRSDSNYQWVVSHTDFELQIHNGKFSFLLSADQFTILSFRIKLDCNCGLKWKILKIKYLVVNSELSSLIEIKTIHDTLGGGGGKKIGPGTIIDYNFGLSNNVNSLTTKVSIILRSLEIFNSADPLDIDIFMSYQWTETTFPQQIKVKITNTIAGDITKIKQIGFSLIVIDTAILTNIYGGSFEQQSIHFYGIDYKYYTNSASQYYNDAIFWGLKNIHSIQNKIKFNFQLFNLTTIFITPATYPYNNFEADFINFIITPCSSSQFYYKNNSTNYSCFSNCPIGTYINLTTSECLNCSVNCYQCQIAQNNCTLCFNGTYLYNNSCLICPSECINCSSTINCTSCTVGYFLNNSVCIDINSIFNCSSSCTSCTTATNCTDCSIGYDLINGSCYLNCSVISNCNQCQLNPFNIITCINCSVAYIISNGICVPLCGDGVMLQNEQCDDNNTNDSDGCSSSCTVQQYYSCSNSTLSTPSICYIQSLNIQYDYSIKNRHSNSFTSFYVIQPATMAFSALKWVQVLSFKGQQIQITSIQYDLASSTLKIQSNYKQNIQNKMMNLTLNFNNQSGIFSQINVTDLSFNVLSTNNVPLFYYTQTQYTISHILQIICIIISLLSLLMFIVGYFGAKLIALQHIAVVQLTWVSLIAIQQPSITLQSLKMLKLSFGYNKIQQYDYSHRIQANVKFQQLYLNPLLNYWMILPSILIPLLVAIILKTITIIKEWKGQHQKANWRKIFIENFYYGLLLCSYIAFTSLMVDIVHLSSSNLQAYLGLIIGIIFTVIFLVSIFIFYRQSPKYFGQFKKKFKKFEISQYYYAFVGLQRLASVVIIFMTNNLTYGLCFEIIILGAQLTFVLYVKPYINNKFWRPAFCLAVTISILIMLSISNIFQVQSQKSQLSMYMPVLIVVCLVVSLVINLKAFIIELRQIYKTRKLHQVNELSQQKVISDNPQQKANKENSQIESQDQDIQAKNDKIMKIFQQRMFQGNQQMLKIINKNFSPYTKDKINNQWQNYPILSQKRMPPNIKEKMLQKKIINQYLQQQ